MSDVDDANVVFVQKHSPEQRAALENRTEKKRKENRTSSTWKLSHSSKCLRCSSANTTWASKAAASCFEITSPCTPVTLVMRGRPLFFVFTSSRSGPACSRKKELHQGRGRGGLCPLPRGVRRAGPHPNGAQLGSTVLKCGIMGELCKLGERAGLFLGMCVCVFGPRLSVKSDLAARLTLASPVCCPKRTSGAFSLTRVSRWPVCIASIVTTCCPQPLQFRLFWGENYLTNRSAAHLWIRKVSRLHLEVSAKTS